MLQMKYLIAVALAVSVILTLRWGWTERAGFEDELAHAVLSEEIRRGDSRCPLSTQAIDRAPLWLLHACAAGGLDWHKAAALYGDDAANVFGVYGQDQVFTDVFERFGHPVVPVIAYFVRNGSKQYRLQETVGRGLSRLWHDGEFSFGLADLTPEQYGLVAIHELADRGHELLSEFEIVGGVAVRKQFTRTVLGAKNILLGGVSDLEGVLARGERLPTWGEIGWAAFDGVIVVGAVGGAAKALRAARAPIAAAGRGPARMTHFGVAGRGTIRSLATVGKAAGVAAIVAIPYVAITRPHLVAAAGGWLAEQAGLPAWLGVFAAYALLCLVVGTLLRIILGPLAWTIQTTVRCLSWIAGGLRLRSGQGTA
jgi:hypothetical protein